MSEFSPMRGSFPQRDKIKCRDCVYRDKTVIDIGTEKIACGVTRDFCEMYPKPPKSNGKPHEVLFENAECDYYMHDG